MQLPGDLALEDPTEAASEGLNVCSPDFLLLAECMVFVD